MDWGSKPKEYILINVNNLSLALEYILRNVNNLSLALEYIKNYDLKDSGPFPAAYSTIWTILWGKLNLNSTPTR